MPAGQVLRDVLQRRDIALATRRAALARRLGLADNELLALVHLALHEECTPSRLGSALRLSSGGTTALVQRLERAGHIQRHRHPRDRRSSLLRLSPRIATQLAEVDDVLAARTDELGADLGPAVDELLRGLAETAGQLADGERRARPGPPRLVPSLWG